MMQHFIVLSADLNCKEVVHQPRNLLFQCLFQHEELCSNILAIQMCSNDP